MPGVRWSRLRHRQAVCRVRACAGGALCWGRTLRAGEQVDLTGLVGRYARAVVIPKSTADGRTVNAVQELLPARSVKPTPAPVEEDPFA